MNGLHPSEKMENMSVIFFNTLQYMACEYDATGYETETCHFIIGTKERGFMEFLMHPGIFKEGISPDYKRNIFKEY